MVTLEKILAFISKEMKVSLRDREALLILFVMPLVFVIIMSLSLQNAFKEKGGGVVFTGLIMDFDDGRVGEAITGAFSEVANIDAEKAEENDETRMRKDIADGLYKFGVIIPEGVTERIDQSREKGMLGQSHAQSADIRLFVDPTMQADHRSLIVSAVNQVLLTVELRLLKERMRVKTTTPPLAAGTSRQQADKGQEILMFGGLKAENVLGEGIKMPTSVQQNVPGWSLFAMFFIVIPLSVAFIKERQQGSFVRLMSMPVSAWIIISGKAIPFFIINQVQLILMIMAGMFIVPLFGGDVLEIGNSPGALIVIAFCASSAAVGYGLMVSMFCKTTEQATTFGGTSAIIFGALGGVMVPKFVMPSFMQKITFVSPLSWGLEGFLDIFVRNGTVHDIMPEALALILFSAGCTGVAILRFRAISRSV